MGGQSRFRLYSVWLCDLINNKKKDLKEFKESAEIAVVKDKDDFEEIKSEVIEYSRSNTLLDARNSSQEKNKKPKLSS